VARAGYQKGVLMLRRPFISMLVVLLLVVAGCSSSDPTVSDEYAAIEQELAQIEAQLADMTAEGDALAAEAASSEDRYEGTRSTQETVLAIMADPSSFGSEEEVLDLLDGLAVPGIVYGDDAFGPTMWRTGWRNTLFGQVDATITTWKSWLSDDGSAGGSMFSWYGTAQNGEPFVLNGIELSTFNDDGLYNTITVYYPYNDDEVRRLFSEGN
jgi:hypothetical protein